MAGPSHLSFHDVTWLITRQIRAIAACDEVLRHFGNPDRIGEMRVVQHEHEPADTHQLLDRSAFG